jgi:hypothetical protein
MRPLQMSGFQAQARPFSVAYNVKSKFEEAYTAKMENMKKVTKKT